MNILALEGTLLIIEETGNRQSHKGQGDRQWKKIGCRGRRLRRGVLLHTRDLQASLRTIGPQRLPGESTFRAEEGSAKFLRTAAHEDGAGDWE